MKNIFKFILIGLLSSVCFLSNAQLTPTPQTHNKHVFESQYDIHF